MEMAQSPIQAAAQIATNAVAAAAAPAAVGTPVVQQGAVPHGNPVVQHGAVGTPVAQHGVVQHGAVGTPVAQHGVVHHGAVGTPVAQHGVVHQGVAHAMPVQGAVSHAVQHGAVQYGSLPAGSVISQTSFANTSTVPRTQSTIVQRVAPAGIYHPNQTNYVAPGHPLRNGMKSTYDVAFVPTFESKLEWVAAGENSHAAQKLEQIVHSQHDVYVVGDHAGIHQAGPHGAHNEFHGQHMETGHFDEHGNPMYHDPALGHPVGGTAAKVEATKPKKKKFGCC